MVKDIIPIYVLHHPTKWKVAGFSTIKYRGKGMDTIGGYSIFYKCTDHIF